MKHLHSRRGFSTLAGVMVLLGVIAVVSLTRLQTSRQLSSQVQRARLDTLAELQARSAIQEALQRLARDVNQRDTPVYRRLREHLGEAWTEIDVTDLLAFTPTTLAPTWGRVGGLGAGQADASAYDLKAKLFSPRAFPGAELDEWTALLALEAVGEVADARLRVRRRVEERYELRMVRVGLPRPFDQVAFLGPLEAVTDPARANRAREELLAIQPRLVNEVLAHMDHQLDPSQKDRLEAILKGMIPANDQAARTPQVTVEPALVAGFHHARMVPFRLLDLAASMETDLGLAKEREAEVKAAALGSAEQVEAVYNLVDTYSRGLERVWTYGVRTRLHAPGAEGTLGPYLDRLDPESLAARASLRAPAEHPRVAAWLAGELRLDGVLDLRQARQRLVLSGELMGKVLLLVGPAGVRLENLNRRAPARGDRLVVACAGGDVEMGGDVRAQVLSLPVAADQPESAGAVRLDPSTRLVGGLVAPFARRGQLELDGMAIPDQNQTAPWPVSAGLDRPDGGGYQVVIAPEPLWTEGEAR